MLVNIDDAITGLLVNAATAICGLLYSPVATFRNRRTERDIEIVGYLESYSLTVTAPVLPDLTSKQAERLADLLRCQEVQAALQGLLAARLTDASASEISQVQLLWYGTLTFSGVTDESIIDLLFKFYDDKICELVAGLEAKVGYGGLAQVRQEANSFRIVNILRSIERHTAALVKVSNSRNSDDFVPRYRRHIIDEHGKIQPPDFERRRKIPIEQIYVYPSIYEIDNSMQASAGREMRLDNLITELDRSVLLGDPGAGKTSAVNVLAYKIARAENSLIPFIVTLRDFAEKDPPERSIAEYIEHILKNFYQCPPPSGYIDFLLLTGRAVVIFDGLDELTDPTRREKVSARVERFCTEYPLAKVLVTSRIVGYDEARLDDRQFVRYRLGKFSNAQVEEYVRKWFAQETSADAARRLGDAFMKESETVIDLRSNPLLLSLLCILYRGAESLPRRRTEVYEQCTRLLLEKWDARRHIHTDLKAGHLIDRALRHLAFWLFTREVAQSVVTERELIRETTSFFLGRGFELEAEAKVAAEEFVAFCRGRVWVFSDAGTTVEGESLYGFTHRTFLEYFAASFLAANANSPEDLADLLFPEIVKLSWDVVAELAIQIKDRSSSDGADRIYQKLLHDISPELAVESRRNIFEFLTMCLRSVDPEPQVVRSVTRPVINDLFFGGKISAAPNSRSGTPWPQSVSNLLLCGRHCRDTVKDEISLTIGEHLTSQDLVDLTASLRIAVAFPQAFPSAFAADADERLEFWRNCSNQVILSHAAIARKVAARDGGVRSAALKVNLISIVDALAMEGGLSTLFESYESFPCPNTFLPYLENTFRSLLAGWPFFGADSVRRDLAGVGRYLTQKENWRPPWIKGTVGEWEGVASAEVNSSKVEGAERPLKEAEYLGAVAILAVINEQRARLDEKYSPKKLGPLADFYPYLALRHEYVNRSLPELPVPAHFKYLFKDWAKRKFDFVGVPISSQ